MVRVQYPAMLLPALTLLSFACVLTGFPRYPREPTNKHSVLHETPQNTVPVLRKLSPQYWQTLGQQGYSLSFPQSDDNIGRDFIPTYIQRALVRKNKVVPRIPEKKHTIYNLTLQDVFSRISDITRALNYKAYENGYKVDYKFRILDRLE